MDYDPTTDILSVGMPNVNLIYLPEIKRSLTILTEHVRNYDVKNLLIDARQTEVEVPEEQYTALLTEFMRDLTTTRIRKIARIVSISALRETVVKKAYTENNLPFILQSFEDLSPALAWLKE